MVFPSLDVDSALVFPYNDFLKHRVFLEHHDSKLYRLHRNSGATVAKGDRKMSDVDMLRTLLPNWIERNAEHAAEVREWVERVQQAGEDSAAQGIVFAANALETATEALQAALKQLGGPLE